MARATPGILTYPRADGTRERLLLRQEVTTIGRSDGCTVVIPLAVISRQHACIELRHDRYVLFDASSVNGTFVDGKRLKEGHQLGTGDTIWLGSSDVVLEFTDPDETLVVPSSISVPSLYIDEYAHTVQVSGVPVHLSPREYNLLVHLANNPGTVCTRESIFTAVWGQTYNHVTCEDALNACIAKLRRNLRSAAGEAGVAPPTIATVQRIGCRLDADVAFAQRRPMLVR